MHVPLQEKDQRSLDLNTAKCMLGLLLGKTWPLFPVFNQFLEVLFLSFTFFVYAQFTIMFYSVKYKFLIFYTVADFYMAYDSHADCF